MPPIARSFGYRVLSHTAEVIVEIRAENWAEFYRQAACALLTVHSPRPANGTLRKFRVCIDAEGPEEALVSWLNEIIYIVSARRCLPRKIRIVSAGSNFIEAVLFGAAFGREGGIMKEVKAATYGDLKVRRSAHRIMARVILDV
ncbi:MAG: archease [Elusimicrobia bacterium]|nr:archease [Elusimicrobiota bacterium]